MAIANVRVELRPGSRYDERAFRILLKEFNKKVADAGILHDYKEHQTFESKSRKARRKRHEVINKLQQESIEEKLNRGEKVRCSSKLIKKIRSSQAKKFKKRDYNREDRRKDY